jgi:hypothetical protein
MKELELLNLSEQDFKLITDGLDALPQRDMAGDMMFGLLEAALTKDDPTARDKFKEDRIKDKANKERQKALMIEDIKILQGKLLMFQRYLRMNGLLKEANDILK